MIPPLVKHFIGLSVAVFSALISGLSAQVLSSPAWEIEAHNALFTKRYEQALSLYRAAEQRCQANAWSLDVLRMQEAQRQIHLAQNNYAAADSLLSIWQNRPNPELKLLTQAYVLDAQIAEARRQGNRIDLAQLTEAKLQLIVNFKANSRQDSLQAIYLYPWTFQQLSAANKSEQGMAFCISAQLMLDALKMSPNLIEGHICFYRFSNVSELSAARPWLKKIRTLEQAFKPLSLHIKDLGLKMNYSFALNGSDTLKVKAAFTETYDFLKTYFGEQRFEMGQFYHNLATSYKDVWSRATGYDSLSLTYSTAKAIAAYKKAIAINSALVQDHPSNSTYRLLLSHNYLQLGYVFLEQCPSSPVFSSMDSAAYYFERSARVLYEGGQNTKAFFPDFRATDIVIHAMDNLIRAITALQTVYIGAQYKAKEAKVYEDGIEACSRALTELFSVVDIRIQTSNQTSTIEGRRSLHYRNMTGYYANRWERYAQRADLDSLLLYNERSMAGRTRVNLVLSELLERAAVPKTEAEAYLQQKQTLSLLLAKRDAAQVERRQADLSRLNREVLEQQQAFEAAEARLRRDYPVYAQSIQALPVPNLAQIQAQLESGTVCVVPFFRQHNAVNFLAVFRDTLIFQSIPNPINRMVNLATDTLLRLSGRAPESDLVKRNANKALFIRSSHTIFKYGFSDLHTIFKARGIEHLIYVAGGARSSLPLELLLCQAADTTTPYSQMDFMLKHYAIQYVPSLSLWSEAMTLDQGLRRGQRILAYAPRYGGLEDSLINSSRSPSLKSLRSSLAPLAGASKEVKRLQEQYQGQYRFDEAANEAQFKADLEQGDYGILHLAMHGLLNTKQPELSALAFSETLDSTEDNFLHAHEIAQLPQTAKLVVLSACETGVGSQQIGEGTMSLARYFLYGGAPGLIATRWQVNDFSTAWIMERFYAKLHEGLPIHQAMQQAQLAYLAQAQDQADDPFYWAPYLNIGYTNRTLAPQSKYAVYYPWLLALGAIAVLGLGFWYYRQRG